MKLKLNIEYITHAGEELRVNIKQHDGSIAQYAMGSSDGEHWQADVTVKPTVDNIIDYFYSVYRLQTEIRREWQMMTHRLETVGQTHDDYVCYDRWYDMPQDSYLYSSAFTDCIHRRERNMSPLMNCNKTLRLKLRAPQLRKGESLRLLGDDTAIGAWNLGHSLQMYEHDNNEWAITIDASTIHRETIEFKFIIVNEDPKKDIIWEDGQNRTLDLPMIGSHVVYVYELYTAKFPVPQQKFAGTAVPVFSLRSEGSFGIGDFGDLKLMIDWVKKTGQRILQILPINDTTLNHTWEDSYPYNAISIFALHPVYVDLRQLPELQDKEKAASFAMKRTELNALPQIDYEKVSSAKTEYLRLIFEQEGRDVLSSPQFKVWFKDEEQWLVPYAQYNVLREKNGTPDFTSWPDHNVWDEADRASLKNSRTKAYKEASFYYYVQFVLSQQMKAAHEHARCANVVLKGDIPIGVNRCGCDVWMEPRYFNLDSQTGAPPDSFSRDGQNWGFPTYNWDEMLKDDCVWWVHRFSNMAKFFDAYRIDHVLGFFRIWEIPIECETGLLGQFQPSLGLTLDEIHDWGLSWVPDVLFLPDHKKEGLWHPRISAQYTQAYEELTDDQKEAFNKLYDDYFYHRNNHFWYLEAMKKLPRLVNATRMLVCAEDLGMVPECVPWVMDELNILSLEIQSMPKEFVRFGHLSHNPYRSVCTISSHDTPTLRMWWDEDTERTQDYYHSCLHRGDQAPHPLPGWLARDIIYRHLACPSMLCILTLQDWLATDENLRLADAGAERINIPATPRHYWRYRMHLTLEQLLAASEFNYSVRGLISETRY